MACFISEQKKMQEMGLEPTRYCYHRHLKPARLPIPPLLQKKLSIRNLIFFERFLLPEEICFCITMKKVSDLFDLRLFESAGDGT